MSNNLDMKKKKVEEIKEKFVGAKSAVLVDFRGLNVDETTELRKRFREAGVVYKVYKNNLVKLAIKDTVFESLSQDLTGPNAIAFGYADPVVPAKVIKDFVKNHKNLEIKTGVVEGEYYDVEKITEIAEIPSREELIAKFMGSIKSPVSNFVYLLTNVIEEKEKEA
ncbi:MAG: 50S ribosomal protein L10 [Clostridiales bacterium]|nr:50S ribosomal protein L10 [Clostridiales bacterium]